MLRCRSLTVGTLRPTTRSTPFSGGCMESCWSGKKKKEKEKEQKKEHREEQASRSSYQMREGLKSPLASLPLSSKSPLPSLSLFEVGWVWDYLRNHGLREGRKEGTLHPAPATRAEEDGNTMNDVWKKTCRILGKADGIPRVPQIAPKRRRRVEFERFRICWPGIVQRTSGKTSGKKTCNA
jgi:hypothetical protein